MNKTRLEIYRNALVEVEVALNCLDYEEYQKIPHHIIEKIKRNKNENYQYNCDKNLDYSEWNFMLEAKAILYNIIKEYLATDEQKEFFTQRELYEIKKNEEEKKKTYDVDNVFNSIKTNDTCRIKENKEITDYKWQDINFIVKLFNKIKQRSSK